jgi:hypothetical protein
MDKVKLRNEITDPIDSIKEHSDMITPLERIPQLELEMVLSKIKTLYEKSIVFNYINKLEIDPKPSLQKELIQEEATLENSEDHSDNKSNLNSKHTSGSPSLVNESMKNRGREATLSEKLKNKPIQDLGKAIGINEKLLFTKELFLGDGTKFKETINALNSFSSFGQADQYLKDNVYTAHKWDLNSTTANNFIELVQRRFLTS